jgi:hypothetical protein
MVRSFQQDLLATSPPASMSDELEIPPIPAGSLLAEIDAQQDELLRQLDELNQRVEDLLRECTPEKPGQSGPIVRAA